MITFFMIINGQNGYKGLNSTVCIIIISLEMSTKREYRNNEGTTKHKKRTEESFRDWICLSCTNLNYFFRKKCNRCKLQTKELNEKGVLAVY